MLLLEAQLLGLFFLGAALFLLAGILVFKLAQRLHELIGSLANAGDALHYTFGVLEQIFRGILEFHFGHCSACTPALSALKL